MPRTHLPASSSVTTGSSDTASTSTGEPPISADDAARAVTEGDAAAARAVEAVLASERFRRAPNLERLLAYLCRRAIEGGDGRTKTTEYEIAFDVLNRSQDFDPATDSIVRVETHRLRKRLADYYRHEGADDPIRVVIPLGQYAPEFQSVAATEADDVGPSAHTAPDTGPGRDPNPDVVPSASAAAAMNEAGAARDARAAALPWRFGLAAIAAALVALAVLSTSGSNAMTSGSAAASASVVGTDAHANAPAPASAAAHAAPHAATPASTSTPAPTPTRTAIRILAGSTVREYIDRLGNTWHADAYYHDGLAKAATQPVLRPADPFLFEQRREGNFAYRIPLASGRYRLHLYFAEPRFGAGNVGGGGEGSRVFDVLLNGAPLLTNLDILNDAGGGNIAVEKVFDDVSPGDDGQVQLEFRSVARGPALLNAIAILPVDSPGMPPVRIRCQDTSFTDRHGTFWGADRYFMGGQTVARPGAADDEDRAGLYTGERYGNFSYAIPVTPGTYTATLRFSENWFGSDERPGSGAGRRLFNVLVNGRMLIEHLDVFKEAGGSHRALVRVFHGLRPDAQHRLVFSFSPVLNYASLNAIEVVRE